ncbi:MAG: hypothetical protein CME63_08255 [Halobacteriovoraceae bacterium]|jgi:Fe-S-cluster containining protein|nr:hypothetical protein [Halobacteriovoraceae bacterium]|tara:strand:+ start:36283 stop:36888 length:606 start_codon:yes stop_codon:yes gene_type:complete
MRDSLKSLQVKASDFFHQYMNKYSSAMNCQKGCSHCCISDLSIFHWEADLILDWFSDLTLDQRADLKKKWSQSQQELKNDIQSFKDVFGNASLSCVFLYEGQCSIYPRRPIICRTQGMGLKWSEDGLLKRDCCPLNFTDSPFENESQIEDELNLDTLNQMISGAQTLYSKHLNSPLLQSSRENNPSSRITLEELKEILIQI